jgi:hypothetical protein
MTASTLLVRHLVERYELLVDTEPLEDQVASIVPVVVPASGRRDILNLEHPLFSEWLAKVGFELCGAVLSRAAIRQVITTLRGIARFAKHQ